MPALNTELVSRLPARVATTDDLTTLQARAQRLETPCATGPMVWHTWGTGEPVVLLHGGSGSWTHWARNIIALVEAGRSVWAPDLPGFGDSASPDGTDADSIPPWLDRGLDELLPGTRCDVVAFSFGALTAGYLATQFPQRIGSLICVGAPALSEIPQPPLALRAWHGAPEGPERDAIHRHNIGVLMLEDPASIDELAVRIHAANLVRDRMRSRKLMLTDALVRMMPGLRCAVSGIWGAEDVLYRERLPVIGHALAKAPQFRSLAPIPNAGHWVQYECADRFNAAMLDCLAVHAARRSRA